MRSWFVALVLLVGLAPAALAGGIRARIEGPGPDGVTYTVRTSALEPTDKIEPWGFAEGLVDDKLQSMLLHIKPTGEPGVYQFTRVWPQDGRWMLRVALSNPSTPATVASLRSDGSVKRTRFYRRTDGSKECYKALGAKGGSDC